MGEGANRTRSIAGELYRRSAFGVRRSAFGARRSAFGVRRSAFGVRRSAFGVRRSAFGVRRSAFGVRRSAFGVRRSAFGARRSALGARRSAFGVRRDRLVLQALVGPQLDFARRAASGRRDGCHHYRVEERNNFLWRQHDHGTKFVWMLESVGPDLARFTARATSLLPPIRRTRRQDQVFGRTPVRYAPAIALERRCRRYRSAARRRTADRPSRRTSSSASSLASRSSSTVTCIAFMLVLSDMILLTNVPCGAGSRSPRERVDQQVDELSHLVIDDWRHRRWRTRNELEVPDEESSRQATSLRIGRKYSAGDFLGLRACKARRADRRRTQGRLGGSPR